MRLLGLVAAGVVVACGQQAATPAVNLDAGMPAPILATVTVSGTTASVVLENRSAGAIGMPGQVLDSAQLLLEVRDAKDHVVAPLPPPTPNGDTRWILAGDRLTRSLSLEAFPLPPGDYTVRVKGADIESNVASLHVGR